jgi:assimilatory nitrate reductase catalytic subunit
VKAIRTTCAYCGVGCGIEATPLGGRELRISGDPAHPANMGSLCSKGTWLGETVGLEGRLLHPMIGDAEASWDAALDEVAARLCDTVARHGPDSVAFYLSGQLLTEDYYVANKLAKGFIGTGNVDTNSRLCMASAVAAHTRAFGEDVVPCSYDDLDAADLILLVGSNTAWCHPVIWQRIERAREQRGTKVVVIDPRRTETAAGADLHVAIAPDGDVALFNALLAEMRQRGLVDETYLQQHCEVPADFWDGIASPLHRPGKGGGPSTVASSPDGLHPETFRELADLVAAHPRMVTLFSQGANQSASGTDKGSAIINLHLATGRINRTGAGPFSITGQPNAMGGREVGGLATTLACHLGFSDEERADVAQFWQAPNLCGRQGLKAVDMFRAIHDGRIKFLWVMATNPAVSMPDAGFVREALARCPTVVVSEVIADTDTAHHAHIRLPALGWAEKDGTVTNSERRISRQRAVLAPAGEARADWHILRDVAHRLGHSDQFTYGGPADIFREYAAMTALAQSHGKVLDLTDWASSTAARYDAMEPFQWGGDHPLAARFPTPSGKGRLVAVVAPQRVIDADFPFRLNTGRYRDHWHTMTRTGLSAKLSQHRREPLLEIHPADAAEAALSDGGLARVVTPQGTSLYRVCITGDQQRGQLFVPMHFTDANSGGGRTGRLIQPRTDPHSGQPAFKDGPVRVTPWLPDWRGFLVTRDAVAPAAHYWSRARIEGGWLTELAGMGAVDLEALLPLGERSEVADLMRGMRRIAVLGADGALSAVLHITRSGTLPDRGWIARQFASLDATPMELLAGRPAVAQPDRSPIVCLCHDVGERQVAEAVHGGALTVAAIGQCTRAGTNCGSCRPLIARLIARECAMEPA